MTILCRQFIFYVLVTFTCSGNALGNNESTSIADLDPMDYKGLLIRCRENECCEASARSIESAKGYVIKDGFKQKCKSGYVPNMLKCINSYKWCEPAKPHSSAS